MARTRPHKKDQAIITKRSGVEPQTHGDSSPTWELLLISYHKISYHIIINHKPIDNGYKINIYTEDNDITIPYKHNHHV